MSDERGRIYRIDWPEYHLHCGGCGLHISLTATGLVSRKSEAEALLKKGQTEDDSTGWHKENGLWYCPTCPESVMKKETSDDPSR